MHRWELSHYELRSIPFPPSLFSVFIDGDGKVGGGGNRVDKEMNSWYFRNRLFQLSPEGGDGWWRRTGLGELNSLDNPFTRI